MRSTKIQLPSLHSKGLGGRGRICSRRGSPTTSDDGQVVAAKIATVAQTVGANTQLVLRDTLPNTVPGS